MRQPRFSRIFSLSSLKSYDIVAPMLPIEKLPYFTGYFNACRAGYPVENVLFPKVKS